MLIETRVRVRDRGRDRVRVVKVRMVKETNKARFG